MLRTEAYCEDCKRVQPIVVVANFTVIFSPKDGQLSVDRRVPEDAKIQCDVCGSESLRLEPTEVQQLEVATRSAV